MLKKQTIWLLTMLSLMIVLSVYYMTSPENDDLAYINNGQEEVDGAADTEEDIQAADGEAEVDDFENVGQDELFTTIRMELQDERSMKKDRLTDIVASSETTSEEKDEALRDIDELDNLSSKESILEETIIASNTYEDVLVRTDDEKVHVHVKVDEISDAEVVNIMQMVRDEMGEMTVDVIFQPTDGEG
ncbi:SpoIIIAH-like family protein [Virgibacillus sp. YIM 98842]|jgi:stage III sporulation protein AH|uniref:SpoIIIAH-like family protein n=1 Tax=Virgibacillus sp. YIM 98842 TaxID=2663533 RepID=UPI0013DB67A9|nr:SpoIIIAH-like family protein [Virgibacillus sp. YIM 98842]